MSLPKIYQFFNHLGPGTGDAYAISQDGEILGHHICSHEGFVPHDLEYRESYAKYYPDGYELEFVRIANLSTHDGLNEALKQYDIKHKS